MRISDWSSDVCSSDLLRLGSAWANRLPGGAMGRLQDKIAVVTGAGAGIGKASAIRFAEEGATVLVTSRSETNAAETAHAIAEAGGRAISLAVDIGNAADLDRMITTAMAEFGRIDVDRKSTRLNSSP